MQRTTWNTNPVFNVVCPFCKAKARMRCTEPGKLKRYRVVVSTHKERYAKLNENEATVNPRIAD